MARLNASQRRASATIKVGGKSKFPIPDKAHARAALGRINQAKPPLTPAQKTKVVARANAVLKRSKPAAPKPMAAPRPVAAPKPRRK